MVRKADTVSDVDVADQPKRLSTPATGLHRSTI
jgi:hypothetical protein